MATDVYSLASPTRTAVLFVECQRGVIGAGGVLPALTEAACPVLPALARLADGARAAGALVVHLLYVPAAGNRSSNRKPPLFGHVLRQMSDWTADHPATQVVDEIGTLPDDLVFPRHSGLSPTHATETFHVLRNIGITTAVVAGGSANIAIPVVATEAADEGFDVVIARDAIYGTPAEHTASMLRHTLAFIATITTVDELLAALAAAEPSATQPAENGADEHPLALR
ncbi:isochorismatase family protein [Frankia sp. Cas3]|uniref:isochorismatase family protein n=1 Tax=Frankia sp. Cas3 TaxID=3073926 RepID=UPI002AD2C833|nr:isochorismatase family protein [Frankia sp. Cas3]